MSVLIDGKFQCAGCGKSFTWQPQLAGKRAKCACGQMLTIPTATPADPAPPEPPPAKPTPARVPPVVVPTVGYQSSPSAIDTARARRGKRISPGRDLFAPLSLIVSGFILMIAAAGAELDGNLFAVSIFALFIAVATFLKVVVLTALAMLFGPRVNISFGRFWTAVLKFAAIIVITDAMLIWLDVLLPLDLAWRAVIDLFITAWTVVLLAYYLFDLERKQTARFAIPFALLSWGIGMLVAFLMSAMMDRVLPPAPTTPGIKPGATPPLRVQSRDEQITAILRRGGLVAREGRDWENTFGPNDLIDRFYRTGANHVYVESKLIDQRMREIRVYIELPEAAATRAACIAEYAAYCREHSIEPDPESTTDTGQRFLTVNLPDGLHRDMPG